MDRLEKLKALIAEVNNGVTREELLNMFEKLSAYILKSEQKIIEKADDKVREVETELGLLLTELKQVLSDAKAESDSTFGGIKRRMINVIDALFAKSEVNKKLNEKLQQSQAVIDEVKARLADIKNGEPGENGHTPIKGVDYFDGQPGKDGKDADEESIIKKLSAMIKEPEVRKKDLEDLKKELEDLKSKRGGGVSAMAIANAAKYWVKTEQPVGAINGINTTYTVTQPIFAVLAFSLNGEVIAQLPNYTISGKTITFSSALPADYSGLDFEIRYV